MRLSMAAFWTLKPALRSRNWRSSGRVGYCETSSGRGVAWMPFHFSGWYQGADQRPNYPPGSDPFVLGESVNTITTYGFDPVTGMQETKVTLCQIRAG